MKRIALFITVIGLFILSYSVIQNHREAEQKLKIQLNEKYQHAIHDLKIKSYATANQNLVVFKDGKYNNIEKYEDAQLLYSFTNAKCYITWWSGSYKENVYFLPQVTDFLEKIPNDYSGEFKDDILEFKKQILKRRNATLGIN